MSLDYPEEGKRYLNVSYYPLKDNGEITGLVGLIRDITDQKFAEKERQRLEIKLLQAEKMEAIGTLAGGVAHDLNNVLAGLVSYPELLLLDMPKNSPYRKHISKIQKGGERAAAIVQDLLTLARRGVSTTEAVNLNTDISRGLFQRNQVPRQKKPRYSILDSLHLNLDDYILKH
jgi:signal transduction histidine kinase